MNTEDTFDTAQAACGTCGKQFGPACHKSYSRPGLCSSCAFKEWDDEQGRLHNDGGNLYEPHVWMIYSGRFWRCAHGSTGWYPCFRCGVKHPGKYIAHLWSEVKLWTKKQLQSKQ